MLFFSNYGIDSLSIMINKRAMELGILKKLKSLKGVHIFLNLWAWISEFYVRECCSCLVVSVRMPLWLMPTTNVCLVYFSCICVYKTHCFTIPMKLINLVVNIYVFENHKYQLHGFNATSITYNLDYKLE